MILQKHGTQYYLTIAKEIVEANNWQQGDTFLSIPIENGIQFMKVGKKQ